MPFRQMTNNEFLGNGHILGIFWLKIQHRLHKSVHYSSDSASWVFGSFPSQISYFGQYSHLPYKIIVKCQVGLWLKNF